MSKKKELKAKILKLEKYIDVLEREALQVVGFAFSSTYDDEDGKLLVEAADMSRLESVLNQGREEE